MWCFSSISQKRSIYPDFNKPLCATQMYSAPRNTFDPDKNIKMGKPIPESWYRARSQGYRRRTTCDQYGNQGLRGDQLFEH